MADSLAALMLAHSGFQRSTLVIILEEQCQMLFESFVKIAKRFFAPDDATSQLMRPEAPQNQIEALEAITAGFRSKLPSMCPEGHALMDALAQAGVDVLKMHQAQAEQNLVRQDQRIRAQRLKALELEVQIALKRRDEIQQALLNHIAQHGCSKCGRFQVPHGADGAGGKAG